VAQSTGVCLDHLERLGWLSEWGNLRFGLTDVPSGRIRGGHYAEGFGKRGKADKARFMNLDEGSIEESRYYLILTKDLGYADTGELMKTLEEVSRLLTSCCRAIREN
jgi:23S rRNA-intervening sequence protein